MNGAEIQTRSIARWAGWLVLAAVPFTWIALAVWTAADPCTMSCTYLGRRGHGYLLWLVTLAAVPVAAWLLVYAYRVNRDIRPRLTSTSAAKLLYLFSFGIFVLAAYAGIRLIDDLGDLWRSTDLGFDARGSELSSRRGVVYSGFSIVWFSLIGVSTVLGARALDRGRRGRMSFVAVWAGVAAVALVGLSGGVAGLLDPDAGLVAFYQELTGPSEEGADEKPLPIRTRGSLPASVAGAGSGYAFSNARIEIGPGDYVNLGTYYKIFLGGDWTGAGEPREQTCTYVFMSSDGTRVFEIERDALEGSPRHFEDENVASFYEGHMEARPASAEVTCRDLDPN